MTKSEFIQKLNQMFYKVGVIQCAERDKTGYEIRQKEKVFWFIVAVYEKQGDVLVRRNIPFYVETDLVPAIDFRSFKYLTFNDLPDGNYFFGERMPTPTIPAPRENPFANVEGIVEIQGDNFAVVRKFVQVEGGVKDKRFLIKKTDRGLEEFEIVE